MKSYLIIIAGIPASGKTTYGKHIAEKLRIPFICKDSIKEKLYDAIHYDTSKRENLQLYGTASYSVFFHIAECLMKADISFVLESNFTPFSSEVLLPLVQQYSYRPLTILFDADMKVLHKRFCERDVTDERHPGLASKSDAFSDFDTFKNGALPFREFCVGDKLTVDTTDFSKINYVNVDTLVKKFIEGSKWV